jgi:hypothetical protein
VAASTRTRVPPPPSTPFRLSSYSAATPLTMHHHGLCGFYAAEPGTSLLAIPVLSVLDSISVAEA